MLDKGAYFLLVEHDAAEPLVAGPETGDHSDSGLQGFLGLQGHIHLMDFQIREFPLKFSKRPACQMAAGSKDGMVECYCCHGDL